MKTVISSRHSPHFFCLSANSIFVSLDYSLLSGGIESFFLLSTCLLCTQQRNFNIVLFERLDQFRNLEREKERELESFIDLARIRWTRGLSRDTVQLRLCSMDNWRRGMRCPIGLENWLQHPLPPSPLRFRGEPSCLKAKPASGIARRIARHVSCSAKSIWESRRNSNVRFTYIYAY